MPSTGYVEIWASDFDDGSFDNCTDTVDLRFSFSDDVNDTGRRIRCEDMDQATDTFEYDMWVTDLDGNQDFCRVTVIVQDNQDRCGFGGNITAAIGGVISDIHDQEVEQVDVDLMRKQAYMKDMMTAEDGLYAFYDLSIQENYSVIPFKNDDPINGVSTADLVMIQRHLLGKTTFDQAHQYIVADANNSESVSASDISALRKLILGVHAEFQNNTSWRFVDAKFIFQDQTNPWLDPIPEYIVHDPLMDDQMETHFLGIKVGDVNGDAVAHGLGGITGRSADFGLYTTDQVYATGEQVSIDFFASEASSIDGMQFTLNTDDLELLSAQADALNVTASHLATIESGLITFSWNDVDAVSVESGDKLFTLLFTAQDNSTIQHSVKLTSDITMAEAYVDGLNKADMTLEVRNGQSTSDELVLYQNIPNPFSQSTTIGFELTQEAPAVLNIFDVTGKNILQVHIEGHKGYNSVDIDVNQLTQAGVLYYQLESMQKVATKRMLLVE